jgi:hypothetical protein
VIASSSVHPASSASRWIPFSAVWVNGDFFAFLILRKSCQTCSGTESGLFIFEDEDEEEEEDEGVGFCLSLLSSSRLS